MPEMSKKPQKPFFYKIKFSKKFHKLRAFDVSKPFRVLDVLLVNRIELSDTFLEYDTKHDEGYYPIRDGDYLLILLEQDGRLLTTLRRYTPAKEEFYRSLIGREVGVKAP